jgi:hypothetical protein
MKGGNVAIGADGPCDPERRGRPSCPDENHWVLEPRCGRRWYAEYFGWLERHAKRRRSGPRS